MSRCEVSVVVPFFNAAAYIEQCLKSLVTQTFENIEILCVDDCSEDDSIAVVSEYARLDHRLKVVRLESFRGSGGARNTGVAAASGDYICFVDSDDYVSPRFVEALLLAIRTGSADLAACVFTMFSDGTSRTNTIMPVQKPLTLSPDKSNVFEIVQSVKIAPWLKIYPRDLLVKHGIMQSEQRFYEDVLFWLECVYRCFRIATVQEVLYFYRSRSGSIMTTMSFKHIDDRVAFIGDVDSFVRKTLLPTVGGKRDEVWNDCREWLFIHAQYGITLISEGNPADQAAYKDYYRDKLVELAEDLSWPEVLKVCA